MSNSNRNLGDLIESTRKDAQAQQAKAEEALSRSSQQPRGKQILAALLMVVFAGVLVTQYPRFGEPLSWPDPASNPSAAEGELVAVVSLVEAYRISQGKVPTALNQISIPQSLATLIAETELVYRPGEQAYTLDWKLPHWLASYDSSTEKLSIEPVGKP